MTGRRAAVLLPAGILLLVPLAFVPSVRNHLKGSAIFRSVNHPVVRTVDAFLFNVRFPAPSLEEVGDGKPASTISLAHPVGLAEDLLGNVYISDRGLTEGGRFVWQVDPVGTARVIVGNGARGVPRSGMLAREAPLGTPQGLAVDSRNRVHVADSYNHMILRIEADGRLTRVAGTGRPGKRGDGGLAVRAGLNQPYDIRFDPNDDLYIADYGNHRIRKVSSDGTIHTVAGGGKPGYDGDNGPAVDARLRGPYGVYPGPDGWFWIADSGNHVIRRVDAEGTIVTVAGTGRPGYGGDGSPARSATLNSPQGLYISGSLVFVNDEHNHVIRVIGLDQTIYTVFGTGTRGTAGDGLPASRAQLDDPENLLIRRDGAMLVTERGRVRKMSRDGRVETFAGDSTPGGG